MVLALLLALSGYRISGTWRETTGLRPFLMYQQMLLPKAFLVVKEVFDHRFVLAIASDDQD